MEKSNSQKIQLGIFVIIGTLVFLAAIYFVGNKQNMFGNTSNLKAVFANVNGLQPGNNVRYAGIDIGTVIEIEMINDTTININMLIDNKIMHHIQKNAVATISSDGLVGNMTLKALNNFDVNVFDIEFDKEEIKYYDAIIKAKPYLAPNETGWYARALFAFNAQSTDTLIA